MVMPTNDLWDVPPKTTAQKDNIQRGGTMYIRKVEFQEYTIPTHEEKYYSFKVYLSFVKEPIVLTLASNQYILSAFKEISRFAWEIIGYV